MLAREDELEIWHTALSTYPRLEIGEAFDTPFAMGGALTVTAKSDEMATLFGVYGAERTKQEAHEIAATSGEPETEIFHTLLHAKASDEFDSDGFVTRRAYVLNRNGKQEPVVFSPEDAFGLIGLAMRAHKNPSIGHDLWPMRSSSSWFHFILGREILRESWPWFGGVVAHDTTHREESIGYLAQTGLERFQRVLQIRDRLHSTAKDEPTRHHDEEVTFELEALLLFLSASFDAIARVAHVVYIGGSYEHAGWSRGRWLKRLRAHAPMLAALVSDGTRGNTLLQIIGALRNTIHGESLRAATVQRGGETSRFIRVAPRESERLRARIEELGEVLAEWGLTEEREGLGLAADRFVERLLPGAVLLLNELMRETDTSRLPGAAGSALVAGIEDRLGARSADDWFRADVRHRIRQLGGF
jgi:hypothetical protein